MTVVTPSPSYTFPDGPKPLMGDRGMAFAAGAADNLREPTSMAASELMPVIKLRRVHFEVMFMDCLLRYLRTPAAMQLISTKDWPGNAATATVVRAGPPFGK